LQIQVGTVFEKLLATEVQLSTHPSIDIHQDLMGVQNLIGTHADGMGPETIMETLGRFNTALEGLQGVSLTIDEQNHLQAMLLNHGPGLEVLIKKICSKIGTQVRLGLAPCQMFVDSWTHDTAQPGDKLEAKLLKLETSVLELLSLSTGSHNQNRHACAPVEDLFSIGLNRPLGGSPRRGTQPSMHHTGQFPDAPEFFLLIELMNAVKVLQEDVSRLKEEIGDQPFNDRWGCLSIQECVTQLVGNKCSWTRG
jgi:hypothetical protein